MTAQGAGREKVAEGAAEEVERWVSENRRWNYPRLRRAGKRNTVKTATGALVQEGDMDCGTACWCKATRCIFGTAQHTETGDAAGLQGCGYIVLWV